jgi:hypothetical protein
MPKPSHAVPDDRASLARQRWAEALIAHLKEEHGVERAECIGWLAKKLNVRWQTAQYWVEGRSMPVGDNLHRVAGVLKMDLRRLLGPLGIDEPKWPSWEAFLRTPEGQSSSEEERDILRIFPWKAAPSVAELRNLLAFYRGNAERATDGKL